MLARAFPSHPSLGYPPTCPSTSECPSLVPDSILSCITPWPCGALLFPPAKGSGNGCGAHRVLIDAQRGPEMLVLPKVTSYLGRLQ